ncbi:MAG: U32 family peptidase, partial [Erysipelotrichaceae bacterium]|nr:U32 family peptidase [Erysipelotrichaceae bacterium]
DIDLIRECCGQGIEVEVFVHGAICVSYSGQCLMSSFSKNRSANKGMCAQCCRLKYDLYEDGKKVNTDTRYLLSPKDMCLINDIPELIDAGVSSFKIEGRMKSSAYVGYVTRLYRKAIDEYLTGRKYRISEEEMDDLKVLFNRNFTDDLLYDRNQLFGQKTPNHQGIEIGEVLYNRNEHTYIRLSRDLNQFDGIRINDFGCIVNMLYKDGLLVNGGKRGDTVSLLTKEKLSGKVYKTLDHLLEDKINLTDEKKMPLDIRLSIYPDRNVEVELNTLNDKYTMTCDICAQKALKAPLNEETVTKQFSRLNDTEYYLNSLVLNSEDAFLTIKQLNDIRREAVERFNQYRLDSFTRTEIKTDIELQDINDETDDGEMIQKDDHIILDGKDYPINYVINKESHYVDSDKAVICEFGGLLKDYEEKIGYYTLNICNSYGYEFLKRLGFRNIVLSSELKDNEINDLVASYETRTGHKIRPYKLVSGRRVLMYVKAKPFEKYVKNRSEYKLDDGTNVYDLSFNDRATEIAINEDKSGFSEAYLPLIIET